MNKTTVVLASFLALFLGLIGAYVYTTYGTSLSRDGGKNSTTNKTKEVTTFEDLPDYEAGNPKVNFIPEKLKGEKAAEVKIVNISLSSVAEPPEITINRGDVVMFTNADTVQHQITGEGGKWGSIMLDPEAVHAQEFDVPGTYSYSDKEYPQISGKVIVE